MFGNPRRKAKPQLISLPVYSQDPPSGRAHLQQPSFLNKCNQLLQVFGSTDPAQPPKNTDNLSQRLKFSGWSPGRERPGLQHKVRKIKDLLQDREDPKLLTYSNTKAASKNKLMAEFFEDKSIHKAPLPEKSRPTDPIDFDANIADNRGISDLINNVRDIFQPSHSPVLPCHPSGQPSQSHVLPVSPPILPSHSPVPPQQPTKEAVHVKPPQADFSKVEGNRRENTSRSYLTMQAVMPTDRSALRLKEAVGLTELNLLDSRFRNEQRKLDLERLFNRQGGQSRKAVQKAQIIQKQSSLQFKIKHSNKYSQLISQIKPRSPDKHSDNTFRSFNLINAIRLDEPDTKGSKRILTSQVREESSPEKYVNKSVLIQSTNDFQVQQRKSSHHELQNLSFMPVRMSTSQHKCSAVSRPDQAQELSFQRQRQSTSLPQKHPLEEFDIVLLHDKDTQDKEADRQGQQQTNNYKYSYQHSYQLGCQEIQQEREEQKNSVEEQEQGQYKQQEMELEVEIEKEREKEKKGEQQQEKEKEKSLVQRGKEALTLQMGRLFDSGKKERTREEKLGLFKEKIYEQLKQVKTKEIEIEVEEPVRPRVQVQGGDKDVIVFQNSNNSRQNLNNSRQNRVKVLRPPQGQDQFVQEVLEKVMPQQSHYESQRSHSQDHSVGLSFHSRMPLSQVYQVKRLRNTRLSDPQRHALIIQTLLQRLHKNHQRLFLSRLGQAHSLGHLEDRKKLNTSKIMLHFLLNQVKARTRVAMALLGSLARERRVEQQTRRGVGRLAKVFLFQRRQLHLEFMVSLKDHCDRLRKREEAQERLRQQEALLREQEESYQRVVAFVEESRVKFPSRPRR